MKSLIQFSTMFSYLLISVSVFLSCHTGNPADTIKYLQEDKDTIKNEVSLLFVGDVMQHGGQISAALNAKTGAYDYDDGFKYVRPIIEKHDIAIANLEVTHAGKPYAGYPQFSAPDELSGALKTAGFDVLLTCNNHSCDGGSKGVVRTLDVLDKHGIVHTGTFRNKEERDKNYPLMIDKNGIKIALLNYTYGTNGIKVPAPVIINYIDSNTIKKDVEKAKKLKAEYIVCAMHWGTEYQSVQGAYQEKWEKYCYSLGVDMIIGSHPHVIQPVERKLVNGKERVTVWSLGNYVSNQRDRYKNGGLTVSTTLKKDTANAGKVSVSDASYMFHYVHVKQEKAIKSFYILPEFAYNSHRSGFLSDAEQTSMNQFFSDSRALFAKHTKGAWNELTVKETDEEGSMFKGFLTGYYAVRLDTSSVAIPPDYFKKREREDLHKVLASNGTYVYNSGWFSKKEQALEHIKNLQTDESPLKNKAMQVVFILPDEVKLEKK
jgi:poly-gamma-glutamate capsule biosynthesis protein CapA/YwtB (metallophosphatase superfamily)